MADINLPTLLDSTATSEAPSTVTAITLSELISIGFVGPVSVADATITTDVDFESGSLFLSALDQTTTADSTAASSSIFSPRATDATRSSESLALVIDRLAFAGDSTKASEARTIVGILLVTVVNGTTTSENFVVGIPPVVTFTTSVSSLDSVATTEQVAASPNTDVNLSVGDAIATIDAANLPRFVRVVDSTATSEQKTFSGTSRTTVSEATHTSEAIAVSLLFREASGTETVATSDVATVAVLADYETFSPESVVTADSAVATVPLIVAAVATRDAVTTVETVVCLPPLSPFSVLAREQAATSDVAPIGPIPSLATSDAARTSEIVQLFETSRTFESETTTVSDQALVSVPDLSPLSVADSTATSELVSYTLAFVASAADSTATSETISSIASAGILSIGDSPRATDGRPSVVLLSGFASFDSDAVGTVETAQSYLTVGITVGDSAQTGETVPTPTKESNASLVDSVATSELVANSSLSTVSVRDATGTLDAASLATTAVIIAVRDAATTADVAAVPPLAWPAVAVDAVSTSETPALTSRSYVLALDRAATSDSGQTSWALTTSAVDATQTAESTKTRETSVVSIVDSTTAADVATTRSDSFVVARDTVATLDVISVPAENVPLFAVDAISTRDAASYSTTTRLAATDHATVNETPSARTNALVVSRTEVIAANDNANPAPLFSVHPTDKVRTVDSLASFMPGRLSGQDLATLSEAIGLSLSTGYQINIGIGRDQVACREPTSVLAKRRWQTIGSGDVVVSYVDGEDREGDDNDALTSY